MSLDSAVECPVSSQDSFLEDCARLALPALRGLWSLSSYPHLFAFSGSNASARHEEELATWKEEYRQPREVVFDGQDVVTNPDVFPAEKGDTSRDIALALRELQHYHERFGSSGGRVALDMGCGNGALALTIASLSSFDTVVAVDNHAPAAENAVENCKKSQHRDKLSVFCSDMMKDVPREVIVHGETRPLVFDLVVFNHPYYPREGPAEFGLGAEGGESIIRRFFDEIEPFVHAETEIVMPFSSDVAAEHDPARVAEELGFSVTILRERVDADGVAHRVYRFVKEDCFSGTLPTSVVREQLNRSDIDALALAA